MATRRVASLQEARGQRKLTPLLGGDTARVDGHVERAGVVLHNGSREAGGGEDGQNGLGEHGECEVGESKSANSCLF